MKNKGEKIKIIFINGRLQDPLTRLTDIIILNTFVYRLPPDSHDRCIAYRFSNHVAPLVERGSPDLVFHFFRLFRANFKASDSDLADLSRTISATLSDYFSKYGLLRVHGI